MTDGSARRGAQQLTLALALQAALLKLDLCVREASEGTSDEAAARSAAALAEAIWAVWGAFDALLCHGAAGLAAVPSWLGPRRDGAGPQESAGLRKLQECLDTAAEHGQWQRIRKLLLDSGESKIGWLLGRLADRWREAAGPGMTVRAQSEPQPRGAAEASPDPEPSGEEALPRVEVLFPVIHKRTGYGLLVRLVVRGTGPGTAGVPHTRSDQLRDNFRRGLHAGHQAGMALAEQFGVSGELRERWETYEIAEIHGIPEAYELKDTSVGVPMAAAMVGHLARLPASGALVTGEIRPDGEVTRLPAADEFEAKALAAADFGLELLVLAAGQDLSAVCARLWPAEWDEAITDVAASALRALDHQVTRVTSVGTNVTATGRMFNLAPLPAVDQIRRGLEAGSSALVVGGPRSSARTTSVRQAALEWVGPRGIPVIELTTREGILPDQATLRDVLTLARYAMQVPPGAPAIVIVEDLLPHEQNADLDAILLGAARATGTTLIAVCLYVGGTRWVTDQLATIPSLVRTLDIRRFAARFARANGLDTLDAAQLALACRAAAGDIWWLVHLLMDALPVPALSGTRDSLAAATATVLDPPHAAEPGPGDDPMSGGRAHNEAIRSAYVRRVRAGANRQELAVLQAVAACSLLRVGVPAKLLDGLPRTLLHQAGAQRDYAGRWYIRRSATCRALLATEDGIADLTGREWQRNAGAQYDALAAFLRPHLDGHDPVVIGLITAILAAADAVEPSLHRRLLTLVAEKLIKAIGVDTPPALAAHALLAGGGQFSHGERQRLFETLLRSIIVTGWGRMSALQATTCLRAIRSHRDHAGGGILAIYRDVLAMIGQHMRPVLARSDPAQAVLFVHELGLFFEEVTEREVVPLAVQATARCDEHLVEHYEAAVGLIDAALKYGSARRGATIEKFTGTPAVRRLLQAEHRDDAGLLLARIALEFLLSVHPGEGPALHQRLGIAVTQALAGPGSSPASVAKGLMLMERVDAWPGRWVVRHSRISPWLKARITDSDSAKVTPWQWANLIRALGKLDAPRVLEVLYDSDTAVADESVIDELVSCVVGMGDLKGVGHVLSAVTSVDAYWGPGGLGSASARLCTRLEAFIDKALDTEMRSSVVLALVTALLEAGIAADTLRALLGRCADVIEAEAHASGKDHAPRLALLLGCHEAVGPAFLEMLESRIDDELLLTRIAGCHSVEARAAYISLARAMRRTHDPVFVDRFQSVDWLQLSLPELQSVSVLSALKALQAYGLFVRDVGVQFRNEELLRAVDEDPKVWARRLKWLYHPAHLSEALHLLHGIAPGLAVEIVRELDALYRPEARFGGILPARLPARNLAAEAEAPIPSGPTPARLARLVQRRNAQRDLASRQLTGLLRFVQRHFIKPGQAIEVIHAIQAIDEEGAGNIGAALSADDNWGKRVRALLDTDAPVYLGNLLRMMAEVNLALPEDVLSDLFRSWKPQAYRYRSLAAAQSMTCGFAASGPRGSQMAREWADSLNIERIAQRLNRGLPGDIEAAPQLIGALHVWGPPGSALRIADALPVDALTQMSLSGALAVLQWLEELDPEAARRHAEVAADLVSTRAQIGYVPNPEDHWRELGWLARAARALAGPGLVDTAAVLAAVAAECPQPEVVSWVRGCLGQAPAEEGWPAMEGSPRWALAARLLLRSDLGLTDAADAAQLRELLPELPPRSLIAALRCAARDRELQRVLTGDVVDRLTDRGERFLQVGRPSGAVILAALGDLPAAVVT
jgi:hypothetical protein